MLLPSTLPKEYKMFLNTNDGMSIFHGYYRLLGTRTPFPYTLRDWNEPECWRFAWPDLKSSYFFIGFSAWGDHYCFDLENIRKGVLFLDANEMVEEIIASDFEDFIRNELAILQIKPYDTKIFEAYEKFGDLNWGESISLIPPLLLVENEDQCHFNKMDMRAMMIVNGDVYNQINEISNENVNIKGLDTYTDDLGRERIRIVTE